MENKSKNPALALIKQVREETDLGVVEGLLQGGDWICFCLYQTEPGQYVYTLGRVN